MPKHIKKEKCPHCGHGLPMVERPPRLYYDCHRCGRFGHINTSSGTVQQERCEIPNGRWWKIVRGKK